MEPTHWLGLVTPATALCAAVLISRVVAREGDLAKANLAEAEERIPANADKRHAAIGESIDRPDGGLAALGENIDRLDRKAEAVKGRLADTREALAALRRGPECSDAPFADPFGGRQGSFLGSFGRSG